MAAQSSTELPDLPRTGWFKSAFCGASISCVEVRFESDVVLMRDTKYRHDPQADMICEPILRISHSEWAPFLAEVIGHGPSAASPLLELEETGNRGMAVRSREDGTVLRFTEAEWSAFVSGVKASEFSLASA